jgi:hypothetical protein
MLTRLVYRLHKFMVSHFPSCSFPSFTAALCTSVISMTKGRKTDETDNDDGTSGHPVDAMNRHDTHTRLWIVLEALNLAALSERV